jgi:hypothetical protein
MLTIKPNALICALACALISVSCHKTNTQSGPPSPTQLSITTISPANGPDSTQVTITGKAFSETPANDAVFFNGKQATVVSANDTVILAVVPTLAGTGNITVTVDGKTSNGIIFTYDTAWRITTLVDNLGISFYIAMDNDSNFWFPDYDRGVLDKISPLGVIGNIATMHATGIVIDAKNNIYVALDSNGNSNIERVSPSGQTTLIAIDSGFVLDLAIDMAGNLYAGNTIRNTVDKITQQGVVTRIATGLFSVSGVAVAPDGTVYATNYGVPAYDNSAGVVTKISPSGVITTFAHIPYNGYSGMALDNNNNLYVTVFNEEFALGAIDEISPDGIINPLTSANLNFPCGIVRQNNGDFYVVQQVDAPGGSVGSVIKMTAH